MAMQPPSAPSGQSDFFGDGPENEGGGDAQRGTQILADLEALIESVRGGEPTSPGSAARGAQILNDLEAFAEQLRGGDADSAPAQAQPPSPPQGR